MAPCTNINFWLLVFTSSCVISIAVLLVILVWTDYKRGQVKLNADMEHMKTKAALEQDRVVHIHVWRDQQAEKNISTERNGISR